MAKKQQEEAKKGAPEWMATFSDMMTLLLCFFVLLFSMSTVDVEKLKQLAEGMSNSVISVVQSSSGSSAGAMIGSGILQLPNSGKGLKTREEIEDEGNEKARREYQELNKIASDFKTYFAENDMADKVEVEVDLINHSVNIEFKDSILFDKGKADLKGQAKEILDELALLLVTYPDNNLRIEGHTDSDPIHTVQFDSNWELSSIRAIAVVRYLVEQKGFSPLKVSGEGFGAYRNVAPNDTEENKSKNRRVEIRIMSSATSESDPITNVE